MSRKKYYLGNVHVLSTESYAKHLSLFVYKTTKLLMPVFSDL